ncbi:BAR-domain-containing protein [Suhomyces tanzawaensis NRRL Y-17324]|uniref:BAR-domain-containing protein n=1 Tax=Suhomyces tanzawaensis NRRL Y-17324 TaxID=984487 RepID=A0A1E4SFN8_9ASCO|nr:BAR-domain-containing protein [Suhomyces tanzawaensis NRRL Y-17324]ODV78280.1 BAR-domain-containing protein [Suhomyces tanzawaensis NRRL Y-17324]
MSWIGLKKAINRAGAQVMHKTGLLEQTHDKEYEFEEKRYRAMEAASQKLHKELRHYLETLRTLTRSQVSVADALALFYGNPDDILQRLQEMNSDNITTTHELNNGVEELEPVYNQTVLNPLARFNSYFVDVNDVIKKRGRKMLDYDALRAKKHKIDRAKSSGEQESPDEDEAASDLTREADLNALALAYHVINDQLKEDLPKLINLRTPFLDPSFEAFVKIQLRFFNDNYHHLGKLQLKLDAQTKQDYMTGELENRIDRVLAKIKALNIAG